LIVFAPKGIKDFKANKRIVSHVFPGAGKTTHPIIGLHCLRAEGICEKVCIVVPRAALRRQGAYAFEEDRFKSLLGNQKMQIMK
jgi:hypothetical protein